MKTWEKAAIVGVVFVGFVGAGVALVAPTVVREARRVAAPISRMKSRQKALEEMAEKSGWRRPPQETLTADQLDRFLAVRRQIDEVRRRNEPQLERLPRHNARTLQELKQIPEVLEGVSDLVGAQLDAFLQARMPPQEYHWVERVVYEHWRGSLRRAGTYPVAVRQAAVEVETAAGQEKDPRVRARLRALAAEMRQRLPAPPEGFDAATHTLLLARLDAIERWSMDDLAGSPIPVPR